MWNSRKQSKLAVTVLGILFCSWLLASCEQGSSIRRLYVDNLQTQKDLDLPAGDYTSVAWLAENQFAFVYESSTSSPLKEYYIALYSEQNAKWEPLEKIQPKECLPVYYRQLNRLPNGGLAFLVECHTEPTGFHYYLYERNKTGTFSVLSKFPDYFPAGRYSFSPDKTKYVQEEYHWNDVYRLYQITVGNFQMQQLLSEYKRTRSPSWSPDGQIIAFAGNISVSESRSNPFSALQGSTDEEFYPWELFLMDSDGSHVRTILSSVKQADILKWSPLGRWLAFRGQYQEVQGVWILDTVSSQVVRVWPEQSLYYDWSPDGQQMILLQRGTQNGKEFNHPVIIDVSVIVANGQNNK